jgi:hypothetical protein
MYLKRFNHAQSYSYEHNTYPTFAGVPMRTFQPHGGILSFRVFPQFDGLAGLLTRMWASGINQMGFSHALFVNNSN